MREAVDQFHTASRNLSSSARTIKKNKAAKVTKKKPGKSSQLISQFKLSNATPQEENGESAEKKKRPNFSPRVVKIFVIIFLPILTVHNLKKVEWLDQNLARPYPNALEKTELAEKTGHTVAQVNNWYEY